MATCSKSRTLDKASTADAASDNAARAARGARQSIKSAFAPGTALLLFMLFPISSPRVNLYFHLYHSDRCQESKIVAEFFYWNRLEFVADEIADSETVRLPLTKLRASYIT